MNTNPSSTLHFTSRAASDGAPLLLTGPGGGPHKYAPELESRARRAMAAERSGDGFRVAAIDAPGHGDLPRSGQDRPQVDATRQVRASGERALVLGGGGSAGNAWLIGVIAGLFDAGLDVTEADLMIGTSAGSTAAAQITGASPTQLLADILSAAPQQRIGPVGSDGGRVRIGPVADHLRRTGEIIAAAENAADMRRRLGAAALKMDAAADGSRQTQWHATVAARLPSQHWPQRTMLITAVDAQTGEPVVFDRHSGVDLVDAVAASCASGFAYGIGGNRYIDGGYRSNAENADLAAGYARVLVLSPFGGRSRTPADWGMHLATQVDELRARGSRVETIFPDSNSRAAFGDNVMDLSTRPPAARAGHGQGNALAGRLTEFWR
jgi:NTE family protein